MTSLYESLQIYKAALDLAVYFETVVKGFDRYNKYTIGTDLRNLSRRILILVARANTVAARKETLVEALSKIEELKITIRLCKEIGAFKSPKSFEFATKKTTDVARQCEGWRQNC
jgi:hypothetical protein